MRKIGRICSRKMTPTSFGDTWSKMPKSNNLEGPTKENKVSSRFNKADKGSKPEDSKEMSGKILSRTTNTAVDPDSKTNSDSRKTVDRKDGNTSRIKIRIRLPLIEERAFRNSCTVKDKKITIPLTKWLSNSLFLNSRKMYNKNHQITWIKCSWTLIR